MNISDEAVEAAALALNWHNTRCAVPNASFMDEARIALEAAAPILLSHEREETRLAHLDAMVNRETRHEELAQAWERGRVDGYHHRPNPYKETK